MTTTRSWIGAVTDECASGVSVGRIQEPSIAHSLWNTPQGGAWRAARILGGVNILRRDGLNITAIMCGAEYQLKPLMPGSKVKWFVSAQGGVEPWLSESDFVIESGLAAEFSINDRLLGRGAAGIRISFADRVDDGVTATIGVAIHLKQ